MYIREEIMEKHLQYFKENILEEIREGVYSKAYDYIYQINKNYPDDTAITSSIRYW